MWEQISSALEADKKNQYLMIDSMIVRAHQQADEKKGLRRPSSAFPRMVEQQGSPAARRLPHHRGQAAEYSQAMLLKDHEAETVIADKGYDSNEIFTKIQSLGAMTVIPLLRHRKQQRSFDQELYKQRNRIERCFIDLKHFRCFSTRYCRTIEIAPTRSDLQNGASVFQLVMILA